MSRRPDMGKEITIKIPYYKMRKEHTEEFLIQIVPNRFNVDFSEYAIQLKKVLDLNDELKTVTTKEEAEKIYLKSCLDLEGIMEMKYNLVKTVLTSNDYEFDRDWWDRRVSPNEIDRFIKECSEKDKELFSKKKVKTM
jgi:hypothetical protein